MRGNLLAPGSLLLLLLLLPADAVRTGELERNWKGTVKELERKRLDKD